VLKTEISVTRPQCVKMGLKGTRFATMEDIQSNAMAELRKIPKEAFRRCFQQWQD